MRLDAHHTFRTSGPASEQLWPILERNRFDGAILIQPEPSEELTLRALDYAKDLPFIKAVSAWVNLGAKDLPTKLDQLQSAYPKFRGVVHRPTGAFDTKELARRELTVDFLLAPGQFREFEPQITASDAQIVIADLASPTEFDNWSDCIRKIAAAPHVSLKLSGLLTVDPKEPWNAAYLKPFVQHAIECLGPDRLLFGSGWPDCLAGGNWKEALAAFTQAIGAHSIDFRETLLGANAARLYKVLT